LILSASSTWFITNNVIATVPTSDVLRTWLLGRIYAQGFRYGADCCLHAEPSALRNILTLLDCLLGLPLFASGLSDDLNAEITEQLHERIPDHHLHTAEMSNPTIDKLTPR
jgi:hypothetical protein